MNQELIIYRNCLQEKACHPKEIIRVSFNPDIKDTDLDFEGMVDPFQMDQNKILACKSTRRLVDKTQVFFNPDNSHIRTRSSHTHEVVAISNTICQSLGLNSELAKAAALGHDLGHGPAGHLFEQVSEGLGIEFKHERFSGIIATSIERSGDGLNLTKETLKGILEHSRGAGDLTADKNATNENLAVMYADKIAYIFSDINDLQRLGWMSPSDYKIISSYFPGSQREKVNKCIMALIEESSQKGHVSFTDSEVAKNFKKVKEIMYTYYLSLNRQALAETIKTAYGSIDTIPQFQNYDPTLVLALITDSELSKIGSISENRRVNFDDFRQFGVFEIINLGFMEGQTYKDLNVRLQTKLN